MITTNKLLDKAKKAASIESDYRLAKTLGIAQAAVSNYRTGRSAPEDGIAARLAEMAGLDAGIVVAELHAERAKTPEVKAIWMRMAEQLSGIRHVVAGIFGLVLAALMLVAAPTPAQAGTHSDNPNNRTLYIMYSGIRMLVGLLAAWNSIRALIHTL